MEETPTMMIPNLHANKHSPKRLKLDEAPKTRRGPWTSEEDELLTTLVKRFGTKKWAIIAELVPGRVGKQCRERWLNHLRTDVKKTAWTDEEDEVLIRAQQELGNRWSSIAKLLPGRPENSVKNRWNSLVNKKKRNTAEDTDTGNVSSDEHSSSEYEASEEERRTEKHVRTSIGTPYGESTEARSLSALPAMTPSGGSPVVGSSFPIKTDLVPPPQLATWSLYPPNPMMLHQQHVAMESGKMAQQAPSMVVINSGSPRFPYVFPATPFVSRKPAISQNTGNTHANSHNKNNSGEESSSSQGAAQGLLLLATLCT